MVSQLRCTCQPNLPNLPNLPDLPTQPTYLPTYLPTDLLNSLAYWCISACTPGCAMCDLVTENTHPPTNFLMGLCLCVYTPTTNLLLGLCLCVYPPTHQPFTGALLMCFVEISTIKFAADLLLNPRVPQLKTTDPDLGRFTRVRWPRSQPITAVIAPLPTAAIKLLRRLVSSRPVWASKTPAA